MAVDSAAAAAASAFIAVVVSTSISQLALDRSSLLRCQHQLLQLPLRGSWQPDQYKVLLPQQVAQLVVVMMRAVVLRSLTA